MPSLTIKLPDDLQNRLEEAGIAADEAQRVACAALSEAADTALLRDWWNSLSAEQQAEETAKTRTSLESLDRGDSRPASEVFARLRAIQP
jgi:predicted transcriptional regulator